GPFGPITACTAPPRTSKSSVSVATRPPKRLVRPFVRRMGSSILYQETVKTALGEQRDQDDDRAENQHPVLGIAGEDGLQDHVHRGAEERTEDRGDAAEHHHHDEV